MKLVGTDVVRVDGLEKVTGRATFAAEFKVPNVLHGYLVEATVAAGTLQALDVSAARRSPGVKLVLTHENFPKLSPPKSESGRVWEETMPLQGTEISYDGQAIAMIVADTWENAAEAARAVKATYSKRAPLDDLTKGELKLADKMFNRTINHKVGDVAAGLASAAVTVSQTYETPVTSHAQMELITSLADWRDDGLTVHQSTQAVQGNQKILAEVFGLTPDKVRVICPYVGGGFGIKGFLNPGIFFATVASRALGRPVLLELSRQNHFSNAGHRARTVQTVTLGADRSGKVLALRHHCDTETSFRSHFVETAGGPSAKLYGAPNLEVRHRVAQVHRATPCPTRGPGETPGTFAIECAMDELARALEMDPVELRLKNDTLSEPSSGKPYSTRHFAECLRTGAGLFGWGKKAAGPRGLLIGHGVAAMVYPANRRAATARVIMSAKGPVRVQCAAHELGTGAYTVFAQTAADALGLPLGDVRFELGDSALPTGPQAGGSSTTATVAPVVRLACQAARDELLARAAARWAVPATNLTYTEGNVTGPSGKLGWRELVGEPLMVERSVNPDDQDKSLAYCSFGAHFLEVQVDPDLGRIRASRLVSVADVGQVMNPRTARSQMYGGAIYGLGMALMEDVRYGPESRLATRNLADYHVPVHADIPEMRVEFVGLPDLKFNPVGCRGVGEISTTGIAAAVANAVFDATGVRVRKLPVTLDKLL